MNFPCRILYLAGTLRPGGEERQLCYLLQAIDRKLYRPAVAVWDYNSDDLYAREICKLGVPLYPSCSNLSRPAKLVALRRLVRELRPEVLHSYSFYTNFAAWWATRGSETIPIGSIRQDFIGERQLTGRIGRILGRLSSRLPVVQISNSSAAKKSAERSFTLFKPHHIHIVHNGVDTDKIRSHPIPQKGQSLLAVGRLDHEKRWDRLLKAIGLLADKNIKFTVRLAGDGLLLRDLQLQARHLGLDGWVEFLGFRYDIPILLEQSLFLIHTADAEGCPNVILEAMACGRAVVATDAGDVPHLVDDGKTGFVVRRGDDLTLAECIAKLITNRELCRRMGKAGRAKVEREFGLDRLAANTLTAYKAAGWDESMRARTHHNAITFN